MAGKDPSLIMSDMLPGFATIRDQQDPIWLLQTLLRKDVIPHALLFTGIDGVGKRKAALAFAMACLCSGGQLNGDALSPHPFSHSHQNHPNRPCARCHNCRRVASGNHPDVIQIAPEGAYIRIGQIRSLCNTLSMKPYESGFRIVIIANAHRMNIEAGNALLKVLEEPPAKTILVLTAASLSELLPTIVSRCQRICFNPLSPESIAEELTDQKQIDPNLAQTIALMANGSLSKAHEMVDTDIISQRNWLLKATGMQSATLTKIPIWQGLALAEALYKQKDRLETSLEIIKSWLRDVLIYPFCPDKIVNQDMASEVKKRSRSESIDSLLRKLSAVETAQKVIDANGNLRLTLDVMAMQLIRSDN